jgi:hypothetical protein
MLPALAIICGLVITDRLTNNNGITGNTVLFRSKWFKPYNKGKTTLPSKYYKAAGAYVIKNKNTGDIKYVGHSGYNLKKTLYRHFQQHNDGQLRHIYNPATHKVVIFRTRPNESAIAEKRLMIKYKPTDNAKTYEKDLTKKKLDKIQKYWKTVDVNEIPF